MFQHILTREREVFWQYGEVTCAAFSLKDLDTVSTIYQSFHFITGDHANFVDHFLSNFTGGACWSLWLNGRSTRISFFYPWRVSFLL